MFGELFGQFFASTGIAAFFQAGGWANLVMILVGIFFLVLALRFKFEPYLLIPISVGIILANIVYVSKFTTETGDVVQRLTGSLFIKQGVTADGKVITDNFGQILQEYKDQGLTVADYKYSGLFGYLYYGVKFEIYPCLIFLGIGATTDFGPLIANKKTMLLGAAAQIGIFAAFLLAIAFGFNGYEASAIGIIGGADGPTAILVSSKMLGVSAAIDPFRGSMDLQAPIALAAYSYMALVPVIFPPIIRLFTTKKERSIKMTQLREVSKREKVLFPIIVMLVVCLLVPQAAPLIGCLMLGNLIKESGLVPNLVHTVSNALLYICTICLGLSVGATALGQAFLTLNTLKIFGLGILAFILAAIFGLLGGKIMCLCTKGKVNPMIGIAGVSAVPMAARVVQKEGQKEDPSNFLLMHAMGPNVAGVIGSAIAAGILMTIFL